MSISKQLKLEPGSFNVETALTLARVSDRAYYETEEDVKEWATKNGINENNVHPFYTTDRDLQGFFCSWKENGSNLGILAFRGSKTPGNWIQNLNMVQTPNPALGPIHTGFDCSFGALEKELEPLDDTIKALKQLWICGHSLGGALSMLAAARYAKKSSPSDEKHERQSIEVYTFGQPRVGSWEFVQNFAKLMKEKLDEGRLYRITNRMDIVRRCPPRCTKYYHAGIWKHMINSRGDIEFAKGPDTEIFMGTQEGDLSRDKEDDLNDAEWGEIKLALNNIEWVGGDGPEKYTLTDDVAGPPGGEISLPVPPQISHHYIKNYITNLEHILTKESGKKPCCVVL